jgi:hypothetical protein
MPEDPRLGQLVPREVEAAMASQLFERIRAREAERGEDDPLTSFNMRMPIGTRRMLAVAARKHGITMTETVLISLELVIPIMLKAE